MLRREFGGGGKGRHDQGLRAAVTVVIADDHPAIIDSVGRYLELNGIAVLGTAADGDGAVAVCEELKPAVALIDLRMPGLSGLGVLERLRRARAGDEAARLHGDRRPDARRTLRSKRARTA